MNYTIIPTKEGKIKKFDRNFIFKENMMIFLIDEHKEDCVVVCDYGTKKHPQITPVASVNTVDGERYVVMA